MIRVREERNLTRQDLADAIGIDRSAISRIESGERGLSEQHLRLLADYFKVSCDYLLDRTHEKPVIKTIEVQVLRTSPLANTPEYKSVIELIDRLTRDELIMLKGMILAIIGTNKKDQREII